MVQLEEFENLVRSYQNMVFSVAVRITGSHADAEDIAQEVFLKAYDRFSELRQTETIGRAVIGAQEAGRKYINVASQLLADARR